MDSILGGTGLNYKYHRSFISRSSDEARKDIEWIETKTLVIQKDDRGVGGGGGGVVSTNSTGLHVMDHSSLPLPTISMEWSCPAEHLMIFFT